MKDMQSEVNRTDIDWLKKSFDRLESSMNRQTAILFTLLLSVIGTLITILTQGIS